MLLTTVTFAYPDVPAHERARLVHPVQPPAAGGVDVFVLSTCLRTEVAWSAGAEVAPVVLSGLYGPVVPPATTRTGLMAFRHLCRVAAGLESAQIGEPEVLSQFRDALGRFVITAPGATELARVLETATGIGRTARRSLNRSRGGSLAAAAARMVAGRPGVVIIGSGAMARAVAGHLETSDVAVYARRPGSVAGTPIREWGELPQALRSCSALVSTVPGPLPVLDGEIVEVLERRRDPLLLVDLGMPPAVTAPAPTAQLVYRGVDDVASTVRADAEPAAEAVVDVESEVAWRRLSVSDRAGSIITSVVDRVEQTVDEEVRRVAGRLHAAADPEPVLRQVAHRVARRIIHPSLSLLGSTPLDAAELDVVARAFGVERD